MDIDTAKKLNEALKPLGYTVGKIFLEMGQYEAANEIAKSDLKYSDLTNDEYQKKNEKIKSLEDELEKPPGPETETCLSQHFIIETY